MSRARKIGLILLGLVALGGAAGGLVYYLTAGAADAATAFLASVAAAGPEAAYKGTAKAFQASVTQEKFVAFADRFGLRRFKSASWPNREVTIGQADVKGTATFEGGLVRPAEVKLTREDGGWRVFSVDLGAAGPHAVPTEPAPAPAPAPQGQPPVGGPPKRIESTSQAGDEIAAKIGDDEWGLKGKDVLVIAVGGKLVVNALAIAEPKPGGIKTTNVALQFRPDQKGPQTLTRNCSGPEACIELSIDGDQYKVDLDSKAAATVEVSKSENGVVEGTFSADMISLEGKTKIQGGHFRLSTQPPQPAR